MTNLQQAQQPNRAPAQKAAVQRGIEWLNAEVFSALSLVCKTN